MGRSISSVGIEGAIKDVGCTVLVLLIGCAI